MDHAPSGYCTQNLRMRLGARSVHPISGHSSFDYQAGKYQISVFYLTSLPPTKGMAVVYLA
jgi:hypothetical protein